MTQLCLRDGASSSLSCFNPFNFSRLFAVATIPSPLILTHSMGKNINTLIHLYLLIFINIAGYFIFDLFWCFFHGETAVMKFHHILTVTGLFYYSFKISKQYFIVYALGLTEITNPLLQVRWFLKHHGMREGFAFKLVESILILLFFVIRVIVLSYYLLQGYIDKDLDFTVDDLIFTTLGALTGYALSYQMFNYIIYQFKKSQKKKQLKKQEKDQ